MSVIVRAGSTAEDLSSTTATAADTKRWASFAFGTGTSAARSDGGEHSGDEPDRFNLQAVVRIQGLVPAGLITGAQVTLRETDGLRPPLSADIQLSGVLEARRSTRARDEKALMAAWSSRPGRVALLLTFTHAPAFWGLPKDSRAGTYLKLPDTGAESEGKRPDLLMKRIVHRLYRAPAPGADWDYLAYFEMLPTDVAHLRERLLQLRDRRDNKLWTYVKREAELWMVKDLSRHSSPHPGA